MAIATRTPTSMRLAEFSDRELLYVVLDLTDPTGDGWVLVSDVADRVGLKHRNSLQCVSIRFAYMSRKTGVIERNPKKGEKFQWRLTMDGIGYVKGAHLTSAQSKQIDAMDSPRLLALTTTLMQRYRASGPQAGVLIRREVQHGLTHRNGGTP